MPKNISLEFYNKTYDMLVRRVGSNNLEKILKWIDASDAKITTKLNYLNAIISLKKAGQLDDDISDYLLMRNDLKAKLDASREQSNLSDKQAKIIDNISWQDVLGLVDELKANKNKSHRDLEDYVILSLQTSYPVRNDFSELRVVRTKGELKSGTDNMIYVPRSKGDIRIMLNEYKTSRTNGSMEIGVDEKLGADIRKLISDGRNYLFVNKEGTAMTSSNYSQRVKRILKPLGGFSTSTMRKLYVSDKYSNVVDEMKYDAKLMGHSMKTQKDNYIDNRKVRANEIAIGRS